MKQADSFLTCPEVAHLPTGTLDMLVTSSVGRLVAFLIGELGPDVADVR